MKRQYLEDLRIKWDLCIKTMALTLKISRQAYYDLISGKTRFPRWRLVEYYLSRDQIIEILINEQKYQKERLTSEKETASSV